jgi:Tol biopolymer transport system component
MTHLLRAFAVMALAVAMPSDAARAQQQPSAPTGPFPIQTLDAAYESGAPDGTLVVYHKDQVAGRLYVRDVSTGRERLLVEADGAVGSVAWSPDSRQLAFTVTPKAPRESDVRVVTVATGTIRSLGVSAGVVAWTARDEILFSRSMSGKRSWFLVAARGGEPRLVFAGSGVGVITPDGRSLIFSYSGRLLLHDLTNGVECTITADIAGETMPILSPDGRLLAFASDRDGAWALYVTPFDRLPVRNPVRIASLDGRPSGQVAWWTRTGALALKARYGGSHIYRIDMDAKSGRSTGPLQRLTRDASYHESPMVSPDNRAVAFTWWTSESANGIGLMDARGGSPVLFEPAVAPASPVGWRSPDELLLYDGRSESHGFAALNTHTKALVPLRPIEIERREFRLVTQRQEVLYATGPNNRYANSQKGVAIKALSLVDGKERVVSTFDDLLTFRVSQDGRHISYVRWKAGLQGPGETRVMTIDGEPESQFFSEPMVGSWSGVAAWSPDGRFFLYFDADDAPRVMNAATKESWPLVEGNDQPDWSNYDDACWSPDGSFIVLPGDGTWKDAQLRVWEGVTYEAVVRIMKARSTAGRD